ncbi:hypothetical protein P618_200964 [Holospora obtusa F1]|uniref:4Fe-4S ferredoxin-type domain-containing protein n=1 Tax=Holospora obtusa F1 TaxID=1399147 RepID=W6TSV3_HOLOB|nr:hypothetical protein [Holospora obtusa]ETZ06852.1 hypothetical protein P618_200964 [Holospora obtusa F1]
MYKYLFSLMLIVSGIVHAGDNKCCGSQTITSVDPCGVCSKKIVSVCVPECMTCSSCCEA